MGECAKYRQLHYRLENPITQRILHQFAHCKNHCVRENTRCSPACSRWLKLGSKPLHCSKYATIYTLRRFIGHSHWQRKKQAQQGTKNAANSSLSRAKESVCPQEYEKGLCCRLGRTFSGPEKAFVPKNMRKVFVVGSVELSQQIPGLV